MTPKEKADELVERMYAVHTNSESKMVLYFAKQCALVAVDELLEAIQYLEPNIVLVSLLEYWLEVKEEIEKL
jgi:ATP phosphoribosyltransferase